MQDAGITVRTTGVGDRYVLEELRAGEYSLGGEQSTHRHAGFRNHRRRHSHRPGVDVADGPCTGAPLAELAAPMQTMPQVQLINVEVADKATVAQAPAVRSAVREAEAELGDTGRILHCSHRGPNRSSGSWWKAADEDTARPGRPPGREVGQRRADPRRMEPGTAALRPISVWGQLAFGKSCHRWSCRCPASFHRPGHPVRGGSYRRRGGHCPRCRPVSWAVCSSAPLTAGRAHVAAGGRVARGSWTEG